MTIKQEVSDVTPCRPHTQLSTHMQTVAKLDRGMSVRI